jgi:hypothetical protein
MSASSAGTTVEVVEEESSNNEPVSPPRLVRTRAASAAAAAAAASATPSSTSTSTTPRGVVASLLNLRTPTHKSTPSTRSSSIVNTAPSTRGTRAVEATKRALALNGSASTNRLSATTSTTGSAVTGQRTTTDPLSVLSSLSPAILSPASLRSQLVPSTSLGKSPAATLLLSSPNVTPSKRTRTTPSPATRPSSNTNVNNNVYASPSISRVLSSTSVSSTDDNTANTPNGLRTSSRTRQRTMKAGGGVIGPNGTLIATPTRSSPAPRATPTKTPIKQLHTKDDDDYDDTTSTNDEVATKQQQQQQRKRTRRGSNPLTLSAPSLKRSKGRANQAAALALASQAAAEAANRAHAHTTAAAGYLTPTHDINDHHGGIRPTLPLSPSHHQHDRHTPSWMTTIVGALDTSPIPDRQSKSLLQQLQDGIRDTPSSSRIAITSFTPDSTKRYTIIHHSSACNSSLA